MSRTYKVVFFRDGGRHTHTGLPLEEAYRLWNRVVQTPGCTGPRIERDLEPARYVSVVGPGANFSLSEAPPVYGPSSLAGAYSAWARGQMVREAIESHR